MPAPLAAPGASENPGVTQAEQLYESIAVAIARPAWMADGNCVGLDPERFFPGRGASTRPARAVCATCPVAEQCLEFALATGEKEGVWGGRSERERRRLRTKRPMAQRRCPFASCRVVFVPTSTSQRYCSPEHTAAALAERKRIAARRAG